MMRTPVLLVGLCGVLAGCSWGGGAHAVSASMGNAGAPGLPVTQQVQIEVQRLTVPPRHAWHLAAVRCTISGILAVCHGKDPHGKERRAEFRIPRAGRLV